MRKITSGIIVMLLFLGACTNEQTTQTTLQSPDQSIQIGFGLTNHGMAYWASQGGNTLIDTSALGFVLKDTQPIGKNLKIKKIKRKSVDKTWETVWGESRKIRNHYNEMRVALLETGEQARKIELVFRAYNDGIAFRYFFPQQKNLKEFTIMDEKTEFAMAGDHTAWWIPADYDSYEYLYTESKLSELDAEKYGYVQNDRPDRQIDNIHAANTPVTMKTAAGTYLSIHEANLTDYADMTVAVKEGNRLEADLVPWPDGAKVKTSAPVKTPWRTVQIAGKPGDLVTSDLIINLNEPNKLKDVSWIEPMVYTGIWWEMHLGKTSWALEQADASTYTANLSGESDHGANTKNAKYYGDFNAEYAIPGVLIEGWNTGWEYWGADTVGFFDFQTPYPDFDFQGIVDYYTDKGVELVGHHETSGDVVNYEKHLEDAFKLYNKMGIRSVKTGYAGQIRPKGQYHHGQWMVGHYRKVVEMAAKYKIMIDAHEPIKATGIRRTYPNMMTREGVRGMEYNAWSDGNPPSHTCILPFTRGLAGPTDYTPGIFDVLFEAYKEKERVQTTLAKQLALMVVLYSPLQMAADLPENYRAHTEAFSFIEQVAVDWEESLVLDGEIGQYITIVRQERGGGRWFLGSITNAEARNLQQTLDFLPAGKTFVAEIYADAQDADWKTKPVAYKTERYLVDNTATLNLMLAPGGGAAVIFRPATEKESQELKKL